MIAAPSLFYRSLSALRDLSAEGNPSVSNQDSPSALGPDSPFGLETGTSATF
jgi:hypothetical protein